MPNDEVVDAHARAEIERHEAVCEEIYKSHERSFSRNDKDHAQIKTAMYWAVALLVATLAALVTNLVLR